MVERRGPAASESGVAAVQCLQGEAVWEAGRAGRFCPELAVAASTAVHGAELTWTALESYSYADDQPAAAFIIEYRDGFCATVLCLNGLISGNGYAARVHTAPTAAPSTSEPPCAIESCKTITHSGLRTTDDGSEPSLYSGYYRGEARGAFAHFSYLARNVEEMMITGTPSTPIERTLLASGILAAALKSRNQGSRRVVTEWLDVRYRRERDLPPFFPRGEEPTGAALLPWPPGGAAL
jgi:hypothetical protein